MVDAAGDVPPAVLTLIKIALDEDRVSEDVTSHRTVPTSVMGFGEILAKEAMVWAGARVVPLILGGYDSAILYEETVADGEEVEAGMVLGRLEGRVRSLLSVERTLLNFVQRLSGVATLTRTYVRRAAPNVILDTRKTLPGWRWLDKYAVRIGGGTNHRMSLAQYVLIKNNHVDASGQPLRDVLRTASVDRSVPIEIEVRSTDELEAALEVNPDTVMLDNWSDEEIRVAVPRIIAQCPGVKIEVSGGMTLERVGSLASVGPLYISVGALTTKAPNVDISLRIRAHG